MKDLATFEGILGASIGLITLLGVCLIGFAWLTSSAG